jgi:8-oxo-dGTP diphosphatase
MKKIAIGLLKKNQQVLIVRRKEKEGSLMWQFPGGEIEENESILEAAQREVKEESNINCIAEKILCERVHPYTKRYMYYIICSYKNEISSETKDKDIAEAIWVNVSDLNKYFSTDLYEPVSKYLNEK